MTLTPGVVVAGLGDPPYAKRGTATEPEFRLVLDAVLAACDDANIDPRTLDGFSSFGHDASAGTTIAAALGVNELRWTSMVWGGGGGGIAGALAAAAAAIISGQAKRVVVVRGMAEGASGRMNEAVSAHVVDSHYRSAGMVIPAQIVGLRVQRFFHETGIGPEAQKAVAQAAYRHAQTNPVAAGYGMELTDERYDNARRIADPFCLYDCSRESDGAGALLLCAADDPALKGRTLVYLSAAGATKPSRWGETIENDVPYATAGFVPLANRMWAQTGLSPSDIDVCQVYENFTGAAVMALVDHGFCTPANAREFFTVDNLTAPSGGLPINTAGGNVAEGFVHGIGLPIEAVRQVRGTSVNQVSDVRHSLFIGGPADSFVSSALLSAAPIEGGRS